MYVYYLFHVCCIFCGAIKEKQKQKHSINVTFIFRALLLFWYSVSSKNKREKGMSHKRRYFGLIKKKMSLFIIENNIRLTCHQLITINDVFSLENFGNNK